MGAELDPEHRALMLADAAAAHCLGGMVDEGARLAQRAYDIGQDLGGPAAALTLTCLTVALIMRGRANLARPLLPRYRAISIGQIQAWGVNRLTSIAGPIWTWVEDYELADAQTLRAVDEARTSEALSLLPFLLVLRADLNFRTGDWRASWDAARESAELSQELLQPSQLVTLCSTRPASRPPRAARISAARTSGRRSRSASSMTWRLRPAMRSSHWACWS